jgi:signal transduction histidine kinase
MPRLMTPQGTELPHTLVQRYPWVRRHLQSIFEGGPAGQRRAVLLFFFWVAPMALVVGAALSSEHRVAATVLRAVAIGAIVFWLLVRPALRFGEWVLLLIVLTAGNLTAQLAAGVSHNGVFALNSLGIFALVCIVFETQLVVIAAALFITAYAAAQLHFFSRADAAWATIMCLVVLSLMAVIIHGTALYLRESLRTMAELHAEMDQTAEQERARIAGELHDDTIQVLTAAGLRLDELARRTETEQGSGSAPIREVREMIRHALDRTRKLTFELYPPQLDQYGLRPALEALGRQVENEAAFTVAISVGSTRFPRGVEQLAYRTIKELLTNATKHSQARHVTVAVTAGSDAISCVVEDDGLGFDARAIADARRGFHMGLDSAADRVRSAGGELEITSAPARGTRASFSLPIDHGSP